MPHNVHEASGAIAPARLAVGREQPVVPAPELEPVGAGHELEQIALPGCETRDVHLAALALSALAEVQARVQDGRLEAEAQLDVRGTARREREARAGGGHLQRLERG